MALGQSDRHKGENFRPWVRRSETGTGPVKLGIGVGAGPVKLGIGVGAVPKVTLGALCRGHTDCGNARAMVGTNVSNKWSY